jgi:serine/threonine-protein kinase HipA
LPASRAGEVLDELAAALRSGIGSLDGDLVRGWPSDTVIETVLARLDRLQEGRPLGRDSANRGPAVRTLDEQTGRLARG